MFPTPLPAGHPTPISHSPRNDTVGPNRTRTLRRQKVLIMSNFLATVLTGVATALLEGLIVYAVKTAYTRMARAAA